MTHNLGEFKIKIEAAKKFTQQQFIAIHKKICLELYALVIAKTPVDNGFLRGSWGLNIGTPQSRGEKNKSKAGSKDLSPDERSHAESVLAQLSSLQAGQTVWLTNTMPYANDVEFGLYPNPPKRGSRVRDGGRWVWKIKSADGYSKQAPSGMVQVSIAELQTHLNSMIAR